MTHTISPPDDCLLDDQSLESIRKAMNWTNNDLLLVGYCVVSFERATFLLSGLIKDDHKDQLALLDKTGGALAEDVKLKFGVKSNQYEIFKSLVDDRNAIIHAFGFPNLSEEKWDRLYLKNGNVEKKIDEYFMQDFIRRCFNFFPIRDLRQDLEKLRGETSV